MSIETMAVVLHHSQANGTDKLVLLGIANHAGDGGAWPSIRTLARYANVRPRQVKKCIGRLVKLGEVHRHLQAGGLPGWDDSTRPNRYDVLVSCPDWCDRTARHQPADGWAWDDELWQVVPVEQLSTGDTPGCAEPATRRQDPVSCGTPGVLEDTPPGVLEDTQTVPVTIPASTPVSAYVTEGARARGVDLAAVRAQLSTARAEMTRKSNEK